MPEDKGGRTPVGVFLADNATVLGCAMLYKAAVVCPVLTVPANRLAAPCYLMCSGFVCTNPGSGRIPLSLLALRPGTKHWGSDAG